MISAPLPSNEQERLSELYKYDILDTEAEVVFDDLTQLASEICDTPIALISLVDPDRQWFKSRVGLGAEETSRDIAFCSHAILQEQVFEIQDALQDKRFADNPLVTSDPNIRFYAGAPLVTPSGQALGTLCAISDKPKQLDEHQKKALQILSREVISQLELRLKVKQLEEVSRQKTEFLSNMSHELRTPLNAIVSFSGLMSGELASPFHQNTTTEKFKSYLKHIDYSSKRLLNVINSELDLSKIEQGKMELNPEVVNVKAYFENVLGMMSIKANEKQQVIQFELAPDMPSHLVLDESKVCSIVVNLLTNAVKFSHEKGLILFRVSASKDKLKIAVKDHGVGISAQDQDKLFNKYQQVGSHQQQEGTGLGLAITKSLVDLMSGEIKLLSQLGQGTSFVVTLPLERAESACPQEEEICLFEQVKGKQFLVVEDNVINQVVVQNQFKSLDLSLSIVSSGEEALEIVKKQHFDLVFMDIQLGGMDGIETANRIKQSFPDMFVVGLTADALMFRRKSDNPQALDDCLTKPVEQHQVIHVLNSLLA